MANKKGRLNETERFYIEHNPEGLSVSELARKIKREVSVVNKYLIQLKKEGAPKRKRAVAAEVPEEVEVQPNVSAEDNYEQVEQVPVKEKTLLQKQFIHDNTGKRNYAILTENAAQVSDELRKKIKKEKMEQPHVFKPNPTGKSR
jgi:transposase